MKPAISRSAPSAVVIALFFAITAAAIAAYATPSGPAGARRATAPPKLTASISASGQVALTDRNGHAVARLRRGWYTLLVRVESSRADFHMSGPAVHRATRARFTGEALWGIHFLKGAYRRLPLLQRSQRPHDDALRLGLLIY
jgi:hypothetical protein